MRIVEGRRFGICDRLTFYPNAEETLALVEALSARSAVRIKQTDVVVEHPAIVWSGIFRTSCIELSGDEELLAAMSRSSRQQVRRVEALGNRVEIRTGGDELAAEFRVLYGAFVRAKGHTRPLSARRVSEYLKVSDVWLISIDDQLVCGRLILRDEDVGRVRNLYEANSRFGDGALARLSSSLNRYLDWEAMRYYRDRGFVTWDWGGIGARQKGDGKSYKRSMGGEIREERSYVLAGGVGRQAYRVFTRLR